VSAGVLPALAFDDKPRAERVVKRRVRRIIAAIGKRDEHRK
jgi:hypothetical protein